MGIILDVSGFYFGGLLQSSALFHWRISFDALDVEFSFGTSSSSHFRFQVAEFSSLVFVGVSCKQFQFETTVGFGRVVTSAVLVFQLVGLH